MSNTVPVEIEALLRQDGLAVSTAILFDRWDAEKVKWRTQAGELRDYLFATDTKSTTNNKVGWKNSTTIPKLTQIRDVLHAHIMDALFPSEDWMAWVADDQDSDTLEMRTNITDYMRTKLRQSGFMLTVGKLVYDLLDYGNVFGRVKFVDDKIKTNSGSVTQYRGPMLSRISPYDIVFNPTVESFDKSPTITRKITTFGEMLAQAEDDPESGFDTETLREWLQMRRSLSEVSESEINKWRGYSVDGFGSMYEYFQSQYVEVLEMEGDWYDPRDLVLRRNRLVTIVDRNWVVRDTERQSWTKNSIFHAGWRQRPDNLWSMGPLDNLVGMQYRVDHVENAKADAIDQYIHPKVLIKGYVEDFDDSPGERIYMGDDGDIRFERTDLGFLQYDSEVGYYLEMMEMMAGAPRDLAGVRTPGNKTKFEVGELFNNSQRMFINKVKHFEETFIEPALNAMFAAALDKFDGKETIQIIDEDTQTTSFRTLTKSDVAGRGTLRPMGARRFLTQNKLLQDLVQWANSPIGQDPAVVTHISGLRLAQLFEQLMGVERFKLVRENIRVLEQAKTQQTAQAATRQLEETAVTETEPTDEDIELAAGA